MLIIGALTMGLLIATAGLAIDGAQNRGVGEQMQATADAASTSAAAVWVSDNPTAPPANGASDVGTRAAAIAAIDGLPVAALNMCTGTAAAFDVFFYDVAASRGPCGSPAGWKSRLEVRIPPSPVPTPCMAKPFLCVQVIATRQLGNSSLAMAGIGQPTTTISTQSVALALRSGATANDPLGIAALGTDWDHSIYAAGSGSFVVNGDVFNNLAGPVVQSPCYTPAGVFVFDAYPAGMCPPGDIQYNDTDAVDVRNTSTIVINGTLTTVSNFPFDFAAGVPNRSQIPTAPNNVGGVPYGATLPQYVDLFSGGTGTGGMVAYGNLTELNPIGQVGVPAPTSGQVTTNPLVTAFGMPPDKATPGCDGVSPPRVFTSPPAGGYVPGVYRFPVDVTGSPTAGPAPRTPTFASCPGGLPGTYIFEQGLDIHPPGGSKVYGSNLLFITQNPVADSVLPNNVGNGGAIGEVDYNGVPGTGLNLSAAFGGTGTIDLTGPGSGTHAGLLLWQAQQDDNGVPTRANYGFNTAASDNAVVKLQGIIANTTMGETALPPAWSSFPADNDASIPYSPGGMLISGVPLLDPAGPNGTDTITGSAVVDAFLTQGNATTLINAVPSVLSTTGSPLAPRLAA